MSPSFQEIESRYRHALTGISSDTERCQHLLKVYIDLILKISDTSQLQFNTLFARVSYISSKFHLPKAWTFAFQIPRREIRNRQLSDQQLLPIVSACIQYLLFLGAPEQDASATVNIPSLPDLPHSWKAGRYKKAFARVIVVSWNKEQKTAIILDEEESERTFTLQYHVAGINDLFSETLELAFEEIGLPLVLGLGEIEQTGEEDYIPGFIILLPDLLLDVTSVAEYVSNGPDPLAVNLLNLFLPASSNISLLTGKVANFFLDELIRDATSSFRDLFARSFKLFPLEFVRLNDTEIRGLMKQLNLHYDTILEVIINRFPALGIRQDHCVIEPSYYSPQFGIKGRLDLYYHHQEEQTASIIELKSGKPFMPNSYGLSNSNYHQTLLYELLIKAVHGPNHYRANFILYSAMPENPLRYAVSVNSIQQEIIHNRNQLALLQFRLIRADQPNVRDVFAEIDPAHFDEVKGYLKKDIVSFYEIYSGLSVAEQAYLKSFSSFIAREHMIARIGQETEEGTGGLAGLWLDSIQVKEEGYHLLRELHLQSVLEEEHQTILIFNKGMSTNPLANFRAGDIGVLYPFSNDDHADPTRYQLHRGSIISIDAESVSFRLRNNQVNTQQIRSTPYWNIEHDLLDSSFRSLYQSLWAWACADHPLRQLILGMHHPEVPTVRMSRNAPESLTPIQKEIFNAALDAGFLYLLWGPPGTGKTSIMLKHWVEHYYASSSRILLLAYTNKAVDEICAALHQLGNGIAHHYLRIGSRAATGENYRHRLIDQVISPLARRADIIQLLVDTRIVVATVSSLHGKPELFDLVHFDTMIIDEASQLLEPAIVGLLTKTKKVILIGDHLQLPAVSVQKKESSALGAEGDWADSIGLTDLSMSYFERVYRFFQKQGWDHVIGTLHEQGRMHEEIMQFVNQFIYRGQLKCLDPRVQQVSLTSIFAAETDLLFHSRMLFIPALSTWEENYLKTNRCEAEHVLTIITYWQAILQKYDLDWSIGVITPFRAQIGAILHLAYQRKVDLKEITIDTVERYQGGARDIIIMSCATNNPGSLNRISSLNPEGVDRKLNVAVTRARQQFILTGVENILNQSPAYRQLMVSCKLYSLPMGTTVDQ